MIKIIIIKNSIKSQQFDHQTQKIQKKSVQIVFQNYESNIYFEVIFYGCGLNEENINSKRLDDCKLGLAQQKYIKLLGANDKQIEIICSQFLKQTRILFELKIFYCRQR
ncbi:unnamed protein product [Paramecium primaurelia]|uniref:Uncharacterized protein n=1 Tax=Paramecium primaurelia TaxID=5886 RepID=A0A8S1NCC2_PARPR|nr:unnamed protein product [Paramecium primaurelia]